MKELIRRGVGRHALGHLRPGAHDQNADDIGMRLLQPRQKGICGAGFGTVFGDGGVHMNVSQMGGGLRDRRAHQDAVAALAQQLRRLRPIGGCARQNQKGSSQLH
jgi:hypothetical protein